MNELSRLVPAIKPHFAIMCAMFAGAAVIGVLLLPGENERVAMLERDGSNRAALALLESRFNKGDRDQRTLYQLERLYEHFGDLAKSRRTLEMLAERRPRDAYVQRQLAHFYKETQDGPAYVAALRRQLSIRYSEPACRDLIGILRRNGKFEQEQRRIERCRQDGYRRVNDLVRLAFLSAADGNLTMTAELLSAVDDRRKLVSERQQMMLFEALLHTNQPGDARHRATRWLKGADNDELALTLINRLSQQKRYDLAIGLARDVSHPGDSLSLTVAALMLDQDQAVAARSYLRGWLDKTDFSQAGTVDRFIAASLDADDLQLALAGARRFGLGRLSSTSLVALCEATGGAGMKKEFRQLVDSLSTDALQADLLLASMVANETGDRDLAVKLFAKVPRQGLNEWRQALWKRLALALAHSGRR